MHRAEMGRIDLTTLAIVCYEAQLLCDRSVQPFSGLRPYNGLTPNASPLTSFECADDVLSSRGCAKGALVGLARKKPHQIP